MNVIETDSLTKYYGKSRGIKNLNLTVKKGDFFGFIGPNGAGKSTTIRTLLGLISKDSGKASIFGLDTEKENLKILSRIGYMPSEAVFYNKMKVRDVINFSAKLHKMDCTDTSSELCQRLQLDTAKRIEDLSLGNRKKVAIVCALQHSPELYILDEPTSGLDPLMQREFFKLLQERNNDGATVFLSSHVLSEIQHYCNNAAIIRDGTIIADGDLESLSKTNTRRISIRGAVDFSTLPGIRSLQSFDKSSTFLFNGDINNLVNFLYGKNIKDISITEPDLEEVFMHYYTDGGNKNDNL